MAASSSRAARWIPRPGSWLKRQRGRTEDPGKSAEPAFKVAVVTDSTAALSEELEPGLLAHEALRIVATPVMIGEHIFDEGKDDVLEPLALAFAEGVSVKTSRPSPGAFERTYRELAERGYTEIVSIHLSSDLSGTVDSARLAASQVEVPVTVLDSRSVATGLGMAVLAALAVAEAGGDAEAVTAAAEDSARTATLLFLVPSLDYLRKGGRISVAAGFFGQLLDVKPLLKLVEGHIVPIEKVRSNTKAINRLAALAIQASGADGGGTQGSVGEGRGAEGSVGEGSVGEGRGAEGSRAVVHYFGKPGEPTEQARLLGKALANDGGLDVRFVPTPAVLAAHAGPGVIAVVVAAAR